MCSHTSLLIDTLMKQILPERHVGSGFTQTSYGLVSYQLNFLSQFKRWELDYKILHKKLDV